MRVVGMAEAKSKLAELVGQVKFGGQHFILERRGRPMAVLISVEEYESLKRQPSGAGEQESPLSPELRRRQQALVGNARRLRAEIGVPEEQLAQLFANLPPESDSFWLELQELD